MVQIKDEISRICKKLSDKNFLKGISTLMGACIINFFAGAIYSLCTLSVYEISYIKEKGGSINIDHLSFYYPIEIIFQCFSSIVSGIVYKEFGLHLTNLVGVTILSFGYFMMYISSSLGLDLVSMILGGIGTGVILYPSTTNAYKWFTEHNGIIVGIMETMISFGSFFFAFIGEKIVNPNEDQSREEDSLYDFSIGVKVKTYLLMQVISLIGAFILSFILMFEKKDDNVKEIMEDIEKTSNMLSSDNQNDLSSDTDDLNSIGEGKKESLLNKKEQKIALKDETDTNNESNDKDGEENKKDDDDTLKIDEEKIREEKINKKEIIVSGKNQLIVDDIDDEEEKKTQRPVIEKDSGNENEEVNLLAVIKFALKSKRLMLFSAIVILQAPVSNMAFTLYREIGEYKKIDVKYLQLVGSLYFIFECLSSFVFGILCDYIQLKYLLFFINGVGTFVGFVYCLTFKDGLIFFLIQNFLSFSAGGYYPVKDCYLMKVFGNDIYIELSGYVSFLVAFTINLLTPITYFVQSGLENKELGYWILFVSFGFLNLIGLILNFFVKETPLDLKEAYMATEGSKALSKSLSLFHNSFKNSFHTSFHKV
jgi:MFS family permease